MTILTYDELCELVDLGAVKGDELVINETSIDVTLDNEFSLEHWTDPLDDPLQAELKQSPRQFKVTEQVVMRPGAFVLASTAEVFNLPDNISCEYMLSSSLARIGLDHSNTGWCRQNYKIALELKNNLQYNSILLKEGITIGHVVFFKHEKTKTDALLSDSV